ncbi:MAG: hypothetical protein ABIT96_05260, partial [Ferruginibacter sp.]
QTGHSNSNKGLLIFGYPFSYWQNVMILLCLKVTATYRKSPLSGELAQRSVVLGVRAAHLEAFDKASLRLALRAVKSFSPMLATNFKHKTIQPTAALSSTRSVSNISRRWRRG